MLVISTRSNHASILNLIERISDGNAQDVPALIDLIRKSIKAGHSQVIDMRIAVIAAKSLVNLGRYNDAKSYLQNIDSKRVVESIKSKEMINSLFHSHVYAGLPKTCLELFRKKELRKLYSYDELTDMTLAMAQAMINRGYKKEANCIVKDLNPKFFHKEQLFKKLFLLNMKLLKFKQLKRMLEIMYKNNILHDELDGYWILYYFCVRDFAKAAEMVNRLENLNGTDFSPFLIWKARLYNIEQYSNQSLNILNEILNNGALKTAGELCLLHMERGNALRDIGNYDGACNAYMTVIAGIKSAPAIWRWTSYFELSLTLLYMGKNEDAIKMAQKGYEISCFPYSNIYNPCLFLYQCLIHPEQMSDKIRSPMNEMVNNAASWPFPYLPYTTWMLILTAILAEKSGERLIVLNALLKLFENERFISKLKCKIQFYLYRRNKKTIGYFFKDVKFMPYQNHFFWTAIGKIYNFYPPEPPINKLPGAVGAFEK